MKIPIVVSSFTARLFLGLIFSSFAGFISWVFFFDGSGIDQNVYYLRQSLVIGIPVGITVSLMWWNTESSGIMMIIQAGLVCLFTICVPFLIVNFSNIDVGTTLVGPSLRVPVISLGDIFKKMLMGAVLGGNVVASLFFLYRSLFHKEI
ncbi:uncharacterized protein METZ01_LOCUS122273 [marine metagenome]|uniref:Uncharacterized protein n=1 Tax=marine metagenome TaxID=408172 RepID=A0A381XXC6_9ZZZZ